MVELLYETETGTVRAYASSAHAFILGSAGVNVNSSQKHTFPPETFTSRPLQGDTTLSKSSGFYFQLFYPPPPQTSSRNQHSSLDLKLTSFQSTLLFCFFCYFWSCCLDCLNKNLSYNTEHITSLILFCTYHYSFGSWCCTCPLWDNAVTNVQQQSLKRSYQGSLTLLRHVHICLYCKVINSYSFTVCWKWTKRSL